MADSRSFGTTQSALALILEERCGCGASVHVDAHGTAYFDAAYKFVLQWRKEHQHTKPKEAQE